MGTRWLWGHGAGSSACRPRVMPPCRGGSPWIFLCRADVPRDAERVQDGSCSPASPFCCRFLPSRGAERRWEEMKAAGVAACTRKAAAGAGTDPCGILCTLPRAEALQEEQATHLQAEKKDTKSPKESKPGWSCSTQSSRGGGDGGSRPCRVPPPQMSIPLKKNPKTSAQEPSLSGREGTRAAVTDPHEGVHVPKPAQRGQKCSARGRKSFGSDLGSRTALPGAVPCWHSVLPLGGLLPRCWPPNPSLGFCPHFKASPRAQEGFN